MKLDAPSKNTILKPIYDDLLLEDTINKNSVFYAIKNLLFLLLLDIIEQRFYVPLFCVHGSKHRKQTIRR